MMLHVAQGRGVLVILMAWEESAKTRLLASFQA